MTPASGEPSSEPANAGDRGASGAPGSTPGDTTPITPRFLTPPPPPSLSNSPELRKLLFFGVGLLLLVGVTLLFRPKSASDDASAETHAPAPVETPEEHARRVATMFGGALTRVSDNTDFDQGVAYLDIVRDVAAMDPAIVSERATKVLDWKTAVNAPSTVRGDFVRVTGLVAALRTEKLRQPAGKVEDVYRVFLAEPDGSEPVVADLVRRPTETPESGHDVAMVEGIFVRTVAFNSDEKNSKRYEVPYLVGVNLRIVPPASTGMHGPLAMICLGAAVVAALVVAWLISRPKASAYRRHHPALMNKPGIGMRELFEMRLREEAARRAATTPPAQDPDQRK